MPQVFQASFDAGCHYMDMALSLSQPHPVHPDSLPNIKLGEMHVTCPWMCYMYGAHDMCQVTCSLLPTTSGPRRACWSCWSWAWSRATKLGNVFAKYARQHLFRELDDVAPHDGSNLEVVDADGNALFAPSFSIVSVARSSINSQPNAPLQWTVIEK